MRPAVLAHGTLENSERKTNESTSVVIRTHQYLLVRLGSRGKHDLEHKTESNVAPGDSQGTLCGSQADEAIVVVSTCWRGGPQGHDVQD